MDNVLTWLSTSPKKDETWVQFAIRDGFKKYEEFLEYFNPDIHPKKQSKYIFFEFEKLEEYYSKHYTSLEAFIKC